MNILDGPNSLSIYHLGPPQIAGKLPSVFYFALSGEDSLQLDPFNQFVQYLSGLPLRVFSFTLPGHGPGQRKEDAITFAAEEFKKGNDVINPFLRLAEENIRYLINENWIDKDKIALAGLSRGGLFASLLAKNILEVKAVIAFAPITDPTPLIPEATSYNLLEFPESFIEKHLRFYIGNRDERVSTDSCFQFIRSVANAAVDQGIHSPQAELIISPSIGHKGHGTSPATFLNGANWLKEFFNL